MKILHLYYDIMNLYGDYANTLCLKRVLENSGETCEIVKKTLGDTFSFEDYDFVYIGSGTERNQKIVLADFLKHADAFAAYVDSGKVALLTGNSFEMLGKSITDCLGTSYEGAGMFEFTTVEQNKTRVTSDVIYESDFLDKPVVGFINKCSEISKTDKPLFSVKMGIGDSSGSKAEGARKNNLFGTHLTGPALVKNPHLLEYIAELVLGRKPDTSCLKYEREAFEITLSELTKRID